MALRIARVKLVRIISTARTSTLIALGAITVHQLRYLAGYGDAAGHALRSQGHAYMATLLPLLLVVAASATLGSLAVAALGRSPLAARRGAGWAFCTLALLTIFVVQESAEGLLSTGHPAGFAAVVSHGGWIVVPTAALVGRMVAVVIRGLGSTERALSSRAARPVARPAAALGRPRPAPRPSLARKPLAFGLARRPPPRSA
jgi:hypothetical protein